MSVSGLLHKCVGLPEYLCVRPCVCRRARFTHTPLSLCKRTEAVYLMHLQVPSFLTALPKPLEPDWEEKVHPNTLYRNSSRNTVTSLGHSPKIGLKMTTVYSDYRTTMFAGEKSKVYTHPTRIYCSGPEVCDNEPRLHLYWIKHFFVGLCMALFIGQLQRWQETGWERERGWYAAKGQIRLKPWAVAEPVYTGHPLYQLWVNGHPSNWQI